MLHDEDIREPLFEYLEENYGRVRIFEEKNMGMSRADAVMVGRDYIMGIEIKSDADNYTRLNRQITDYDRYFDYNIVVVGSRHAASVGEHVPEHWGILSVELEGDKIDIYKIRDAAANPHYDIKNKVRFLWRPELAHIQEICGFPAYKGKSKEFVREYLVDKLDERELSRLISEELFERDYTTIGEEIQQYRKAKNPNKRIRKKKISRRRRV